MNIIKKYIKKFDDVYESIKLIENLDTLILVLQWNFLSENYEKLKSFLTINQKVQLEKYLKIEDKYNYASTHAIVNIIFSKIKRHNICHEHIKFYNGKPYIENINNIRYNISHTQKCAVIAFSANEVGVDIESYRYEFDYIRILERYFIYELNTYRNIDLKKFYTLWTIKEAYLKFSRNGIKHIGKIDIISLEQEKAVVKDNDTQEIFDIYFFYISKSFVISICCEK